LEDALARLESAKDLTEERRALQQIHRLARQQMAVIPLWQLTQHLAYRRGLEGIGQAPVSLYQHLEQWQNKQINSGASR
jgi:ABC-type oligopeptide transport system substrate-binding subunit